MSLCLDFVKEGFCHLVDNIKNYIFKEIGKDHLSFGIIELLIAGSDPGDDPKGLLYRRKTVPEKWSE